MTTNILLRKLREARPLGCAFALFALLQQHSEIRIVPWPQCRPQACGSLCFNLSHRLHDALLNLWQRLNTRVLQLGVQCGVICGFHACINHPATSRSTPARSCSAVLHDGKPRMNRPVIGTQGSTKSYTSHHSTHGDHHSEADTERKTNCKHCAHQSGNYPQERRRQPFVAHPRNFLRPPKVHY